MHMRSHVKVCSLTTYHILLVEFEEPLRPTELHALKLTMSFQIWIAQLPSYWLVSQTTSLSQHLAEQGAKHLAQIDNHVECIMGSISLVS